jgi:hypothetical protein
VATDKAPTVPKKIREAAELLSAQPATLDYGDPAKKVGYPNAYALRKALACRSLYGSCENTVSRWSSISGSPIRGR